MVTPVTSNSPCTSVSTTRMGLTIYNLSLLSHLLSLSSISLLKAATSYSR